MIDIYYTLHADNGDILDEEILQSEHVPHVGELVTFEWRETHESR